MRAGFLAGVRAVPHSVSQVQQLCLKLALYVRTDKVEMCDDPFSQAAVFRPEWEHEFSQVHCHSAHFQSWLTLSAISFSGVSLSVVSARTLSCTRMHVGSK